MNADAEATSPSERKLPVYTNAVAEPRKAWLDFTRALQLAPMWAHLTVQEMFGEFRRSFLGILWIPLGMVIFVLGLGYVYSYIRNYEYASYVVYLAAGMTGWQFIHSCTLGGMNLFSKSSANILNVNLPYMYFPMKLVFRQVLEMLMLVVVFVGVSFALNQPVSMSIVFALPGFLLYIWTALVVVICMATVTVRLRDVETLVTYTMRVMFLVTPILWMLEDRLGSRRAAFVQYNPFFHYIEITRAPLLGGTAEALNWYVALGCTGALTVAAILLFLRSRARIPYWI